MNQVAILLLGAAALLLHLAVTGLAAVLLATPERLLAVRTFAELRAAFEAPFRLAARETVRSDAASPLAVFLPVAVLTLLATANALVPSFVTGMLGASLSDLLLVVALLLAARACLVLLAADEGRAGSGLAAVGAVVDGLLVLPGMALAIVFLVAVCGGSPLDPVLIASRGLPAPGLIAAVLTITLAALAGGGREHALLGALSGVDLAMARLGAGLQRLVWIDLLGALLWPGSMFPATKGPLFWLVGLFLWLLRLAGGIVLLMLARRWLGTVERRRRLAGLSLLAALLGPILLLAGQGG